MLDVSLSNLSHFSISSCKALIIKNAEGDDHEERLKNLNKTVETIIALHYREQCLRLTDCCATVLRDPKPWLKIPLC